MREKTRERNGKEIIILLLIFIGEMVFSYDGTGELRTNALGSELSVPFTYEVIEKDETIQITTPSVLGRNFETTVYHYKFINNNMLQLSNLNGKIFMTLFK